MTTPTPTPAPEQWMLEAAKELHSEAWHGLTFDQMIEKTAACIARHAPRPPDMAKVREAVSAALPRDRINKLIVHWPLDYADTVDAILTALAPFLNAPTQPGTTDKERLDIIEKSLAEVRVETDDGEGPISPEWSIIVRGAGMIGRGPTLRAAADAAMTVSGGKEGKS